MPSTIIVDKMTTQHKMSSGMTSAFPDVCKTPAPPAPFAPIPYPNISNSVMASFKTSMRVTDNKQKVVVKGASYTLSNGDQAGTLLGVVSNKIMGKSSIKNQSFFVKFESKGVGRLKDMHGNNSGSPSNCVAPAQIQPPLMGTGAKADKAACKRLKKKMVPTEERDATAAEHGMLPEHADALSKHCKESDMSATVRQGNPDCLDKIRQGFDTKPGGGAGDTISDVANLPEGCRGLVGDFDKSTGTFSGVRTGMGKNDMIPAGELHEMSQSMSPSEFNQALKDRGAWTGDYDLHDVFDSDGSRVVDGTNLGAASREAEFLGDANRAVGTPDADSRMFQHGPQANVAEHFENNPKKADKLRNAFGDEKFARIQQPDVLRDPPKKVLHFDQNGQMYVIENEQELKDLYACKGAEYPSHWGEPDKKSKKRSNKKNRRMKDGKRKK